jgi:glycopeptide antibiotics resistance protein
MNQFLNTRKIRILIGTFYFLTIMFLVFFYGNRSPEKAIYRKVNLEIFTKRKYHIDKIIERNYVIESEVIFILKEFFGNILLFVPFALMTVYVLGKNIGFVKITLLILGATLCIETVQYIFDIGSFDIDDIVLNFLGGLLGMVIFRKLIKKAS